jgi:HPt (histidine-containing phosphotransfer) domain-containing protein
VENNQQFEKPDLSYLMQLMDNSAEIVLEVLAIFKSEVPKDIQKLENHLKHEEWEMLSKTAHKLKSSVGNLGLNELRDLFLFIEQNGKDKTNLDKIPLTVGKIVVLIQQLFIDLEDEIATLKTL